MHIIIREGLLRMAIQCDCLARNIATALVYSMCVYLLPDSSSITTVPRWSAKASFSAVARAATPVVVVTFAALMRFSESLWSASLDAPRPIDQ